MKELNLNLGAPVHCQDGQCGKLAKVVVDSDTLKVTELIVEEGFLLKHARVFPVSLVEYTTEEIVLSIDSSEADNFPEYREVEFEEADPHLSPRVEFKADGMLGNMTATNPNVTKVRKKVRQGISSDELKLLDRTTPVNNNDGLIGKLERVVVDGKNRVIRYLAVRQGLLFTDRQLYFPVTAIKSVSEDGIFLAMTSEVVE